MMQAVIVAGGKGTRLQGITCDKVPKPMVPFLGKPVLEWQIEQLRENGVKNVVLLVGYLGEKIEEYFGDGSRFGVSITYYHEKEPLGTAGALVYVMDALEDEFFFILGDCVFAVDLRRMYRFHKAHYAEATVFAHPNSHPIDSDLIVTDEADRILDLDCNKNHRPYWYHNLVCGGIYIIPKTCCEKIAAKKTDFEKDVLIPLIKESSKVFAYRSSEYLKDIGTPERYHSAERDMKNGLAVQKSYENPQKAIFIDRDGTVTKYKGLVYREDDLELIPGVGDAIKEINASGWLVIMITNQPVVARGLCGIEDVEHLHAKMETLLGNQGAYLNDCLFCPHHPDQGYPEENPQYKIPCDCRKPQIGLLKRCAEKYHIDLSKSWMVGDTTVDIQTGVNAGAHTAMVRTGMAGQDGKYDVVPELIGDSLTDVVSAILSKEK